MSPDVAGRVGHARLPTDEPPDLVMSHEGPPDGGDVPRHADAATITTPAAVTIAPASASAALASTAPAADPAAAPRVVPPSAKSASASPAQPPASTPLPSPSSPGRNRELQDLAVQVEREPEDRVDSPATQSLLVDPVAEPEPPESNAAVSASRRVRARITRRMSGQRTGAASNRTVLEPLFGVHRKIHPKADLRLIQTAYEVAEKAHTGQVRKSGDPYITTRCRWRPSWPSWAWTPPRWSLPCCTTPSRTPR